MASSIRHAVIVLAALLCSFSLTVEAARQKPVVRPASATDEFKKGTSTLDINRHWGEVIDVQGGRVNLPVTQTSKYNFTRLAGLLKQAINSNPAKYAATAGVTYLITQLPGASFDPQTGELLKAPDVVTSGSYWTATLYNAPPGYQVKKADSALESCRLLYSGGMTAIPVSSSRYDCARNGSVVGWTGLGTFNCPFGVSSDYSCRTSALPPQPFTTSDYDSLTLNTPGIPESAWPSLHDMLRGDIPGSFDGPDFEDFTGPASIQGTPTYTTTLDNVTGDTTVSETIPTHNFSYGKNPLTVTTNTTTTTNNYKNGTLVSTTVVTQPSTPSEVQPMPEIPTDCDFMPTVCSFIDWVKSPFDEEEPDLSQFISDEDFERDFSISGNATCPPPSIISTSKGGYEFSWQPACEWAGLIKPFIIIGALMLAIMINLGSFRRD